MSHKLNETFIYSHFIAEDMMLDSDMVAKRSFIFIPTVTVRTNYRVVQLVLVLYMSCDCSFVDPGITVLALHLGSI